MPEQQRWMNIEARPTAPAELEYSEVDGSYWLQWPTVGVAINVSEDELRQLVSDAILAQTSRSMSDEAA